MSVKSTSFGSVRLTGVDAAKFRAQLKYGRPKKAVASSLKRGRKLAADYAKNGYAILRRI